MEQVNKIYPMLPVNGGLGNILFRIAAYRHIYNNPTTTLIPTSDKSWTIATRFLNLPVVHPRNVGNAMVCFGTQEQYFQHKMWLDTNRANPKRIYKECMLDLPTPPDLLSNYDLVVHFRGTDFLKSPLHSHCKLECADIEHALSKLVVADKHYCKKYVDRTPKVLVVTDDPRKAAELYPRYDVYSSGDDRIDFSALVHAKNLLVYPGSTFSLWAGLMGEHDYTIMPMFNWVFDKTCTCDITSAQAVEDMPLPSRCITLYKS